MSILRGKNKKGHKIGTNKKLEVSIVEQQGLKGRTMDFYQLFVRKIHIYWIILSLFKSLYEY